MNGPRLTAVAMGIAAALAIWGVARAQQLPMEPPHFSGQSITGAYEGWFRNPDGSYSMLLGYLNRNLKEEVDVPAGPNNRIEPGGPDMGQPTHFMPGRMWGIFVIRVPKDFGDRKLSWTITANGKTTVIPINLATDWEVSPFLDGTGNMPPYIGFAPEGPFVNGPVGQSKTMTANVSTPLPITIWVADDANAVPGATRPRTPAITLGWSKFRGPGTVEFNPEHPVIEKADFKAPDKTAFQGKATTNATFSEPGEYILRVVGNDWTRDGGGGFQCCWSNAMVKVIVKGGPTGGQ